MMLLPLLSLWVDAGFAAGFAVAAAVVVVFVVQVAAAVDTGVRGVLALEPG